MHDLMLPEPNDQERVEKRVHQQGPGQNKEQLLSTSAENRHIIARARHAHARVPVCNQVARTRCGRHVGGVKDRTRVRVRHEVQQDGRRNNRDGARGKRSGKKIRLRQLVAGSEE